MNEIIRKIRTGTAALLAFLLFFCALPAGIAVGPAEAFGASSVRVYGDGVLRERVFSVSDLKAIRTGRVDEIFTMQTLVEPHHGRYTGVALMHLLEKEVGLKSNARSVRVLSADGVSVVLSMDEVRKNDYVNSLNNARLPVILAFAREGKDLVEQRTDAGFDQNAGNDGGPIRLMVGQTQRGERNSPKCLKTVTEIVVSTTERGAAFTDIGRFYSWAQEAIETLAERGIVRGVGEGKFAPERTLTRAEFATLLVRSLGYHEIPSGQRRFTDVPGGAWYTASIETAARQNVIAGFPDGTFRPNQTINRQEIVSVVIRAMGLENEARGRNGSGISYRDAADIPAWIAGHVEVAEEKGLLDNIAVGYFNRLRGVNRAEAAVIIYRMLEGLR